MKLYPISIIEKPSSTLQSASSRFYSEPYPSCVDFRNPADYLPNVNERTNKEVALQRRVVKVRRLQNLNKISKRSSLMLKQI